MVDSNKCNINNIRGTIRFHPYARAYSNSGRKSNKRYVEQSTTGKVAEKKTYQARFDDGRTESGDET